MSIPINRLSDKRKRERAKRTQMQKQDGQHVHPREPEPLPGSNTFGKRADHPNNNNNPKVNTHGDLRTAKA